MDIWEDTIFLEWFDSRPAKVKEIIRAYPPDKLYKIHNGPFPGRIYSYAETPNGKIVIQADILDPYFPRRVFGIKPSDLKDWDDDKTKNWN